MLEVCIVTHQPRPNVLALVLASLRGQSLPVSRFRVSLIDNASQPPLTTAVLDELRGHNVDCQLLREEQLGVIHGRILAIRQAHSNPIVFVDDDNELQSDYLQVASELLARHPEVGCFGGKMLLPTDLKVPDWSLSLLYTLGTRDCGETEVVDWLERKWEPWHPTATAGLVVRPEVTQAFLNRYQSDSGLAQLGRKGSQLMSHEDYLLVHGARACGLKVSYQPDLVLYHHFAPHRLRFAYFVKLMYSYGRSGERLARVLDEPPGPLNLTEVMQIFRPVTYWNSRPQLRACYSAYQFGIVLERTLQKIRRHRQPGPEQGAFPRLAIVGGESLSATHGTGWVMGRQLETYPRERILDIHFQRQGDSLFRELSLPVKFLGTMVNLHFELQSFAQRKFRGSHEPFHNLPGGQPYRFTAPPAFWKESGGPPDIIYSTVFNNLSLNFLEFVHRRLPTRVPILQHFLDFQPEDEATFRFLWRRVQPWVREVWALTPRLATRLESLLECEVRVVSCLHQTLQSSVKRVHNPVGPDFQAVMIGNLWQRDLLPHLEALWGAARESLPELAKIRWFGAPRRFAELGVAPDSLHEIVDGGLLSNQDLQPTLQGADLAILPFSANNANHYARYSLPSRISDYCAAGLPIFALAGPGSQVWDYVNQHGIGRCACPSRPAEARALLLDFLADREARQEAGRKARQLAEKEMDLTAHQRFLNQQIARLARW